MPRTVVYCASYGGFSLSPLGEWVLKNLGYVGCVQSLPRHDARLVAMVDSLGPRAGGKEADLRLHQVRGDRYIVREYGGRETVIEPDDINWVVA